MNAVTPKGRKVRIEVDRRYIKVRYTVYVGKVLLRTWDTIDLPTDWDFFLGRIDTYYDKVTEAKINAARTLLTKLEAE